MTDRRLLIVDDSDDSARLTKIILEELNLDIRIASSVGAAKALCGNQPFDLVLLDPWLPDGDGVELCRWLRQRHRNLPIIFYSASAYQSAITEALEAGANFYVIKPSEPDELLRVVAHHLGKSGANS